MKLYIECAMGAAGDMLVAALSGLLEEPDEFFASLNSLGIPGVTVAREPVKKCGISGWGVTVSVNGEVEQSVDGYHSHPHTHDGPRCGYDEICTIIGALKLPKKVKADALSVYKLLYTAESKIHASQNVHFHEVGALDAVTDIVGCCLLIDLLGVTDITVSPVHVGNGFVRCEHGVLPVPAPAAAEILKGVPIYTGKIKGELCTPTGAALLKHFASRFGDMPVSVIGKISYGMGKKDFEAANCIRIFECCDAADEQEVFEISCNLDDMTPEAIGAAFDVLLSAGALDVYLTAVQMKKNRPGILLTCLCKPSERDNLIILMLKHTTTLGVRVKSCSRTVLSRTSKEIETCYGTVRVKRAEGYGIIKTKPEYDDVSELALRHGVSFTEVSRAANLKE